MRKKVNLDQRLRRVFLGGGIAGAVAGILFTVLIANIIISGKEEGFEKQQTKLEKEIGELQSQISKYNAAHNNTDLLSGGEDGWMLVLVNETHPLDTSYIPADLYEVESERSVDARIKEPLEKMLGDAEAAGLSMYVASAYRSYEHQRTVFNATMQDWISQGYSPLDAYDETKKSVAVPGTSEHQTGLAVDINGMIWDVYPWLAENSYKYGFILRYPEDKTEITGTQHERWHFRYVGLEAAAEMYNRGLCLEEYLNEIDP